MNEKIKSRLTKIEDREAAKSSIVVAWDGPIDPKPGQTIVGSCYPFGEPYRTVNQNNKKEL